MMQANRSEIERMLMEQQTVIAQMDNKLKRRKMAQKLKQKIKISISLKNNRRKKLNMEKKLIFKKEVIIILTKTP